MIYLYIFLVIVLHLCPTTHYPLSTLSLWPFREDYLLHSALFLPWMFLVAFTVKRSEPVSDERGKRSKFEMQHPPIKPRWRFGLRKFSVGVWLGSLVAGLVLGASVEMIHYLLPSRAFNPMDALCNATGVFLGALLYVGFRLMGAWARV
jgi:hypothetical protein